jgi:hypothetical protein
MMTGKAFLLLEQRYGLPKARGVRSLNSRAANSWDDEADAGDRHVGIGGRPG